jgi:hypothetical protein
MIKIQKMDTSFLLNEVAKSLDISDSLFEEAEAKYKAVGTWLGEGTSPLAVFSPQIYPQGSFRLGTVTKPLSDTDEYDIDLVFELALLKNSITQKDLKKLVGDRLKENEIYRQMLDKEGGRCWTLQYANSMHFHLDILPAIPDENFRVMLKEQGIPQHLARTGIAITDNTLPAYDEITLEWPHCNPKGYAAWFHEQMIVQYKELQKRYTETLKAEIGKVPKYQIKTPLQRCIQLLKRHRDIVFENNKDIKPASIIITTLAAKAYNNQADMADALSDIIDGMPDYINTRNDVSWVENPVDASENFADRWKNNPAREPKFHEWLKMVRNDVNKILSCDDIDDVGELLANFFGERVSISAVKKFKESAQGRAATVETNQYQSPSIVPIVRPLKPWGERNDTSINDQSAIQRTK